MLSRIIYLNPFSADLVTGGIKVMHRHVEMLQAMGFDASIFSPQGHPRWMHSKARLFEGPNPANDDGNLLVFPETLMGPIGEAARAPTSAAKALLCQNQYFVFSETIPRHTFAELGFVKLVTVAESAKGFLERVLAPARFDVVPVWVDHELFCPGKKAMRIAVFPRKLPKHYALIRQIFVLKYPQFAHVPWDLIDSASERETAEILGTAAVFLAMCDRECAPLTLLEAMAAGCAVVGFHGYGGLEFATDANGIWLRPDFLEETADALARVVTDLERGDPPVQAMCTAARATAQGFNRERTESALCKVFGSMCGRVQEL